MNNAKKSHAGLIALLVIVVLLLILCAAPFVYNALSHFEYDDPAALTAANEEKLSLSARFGERIYFGRPGKKDFDNIVLTLAHRRNLKMEDEWLLFEVNKWELSHGGMSGRTAEQFIDYLEGTLMSF